MKNNKTTGLLLIAVIAMTLLLNIQFYFFAEDHTQDNTSAVTKQTLADLHNDESLLCGSHQTYLKSLEQQLGRRTKIDDFNDPNLWTGSKNEAIQTGLFRFSCTDSQAFIQRKFDGFLQLQSYVYFDINIDGFEDIEWAVVYFMEDLSYSNYFECNLLPLLSEGKNNTLINKKDFIIGSGVPDWSRISTIKMAFKTAKGKKSHVSMEEISTYDAQPLCSIWFDDGWLSTYSQAYPQMRAKNLKGIISVVSSQVGYPSFCNETQLKEMYDSGWDLVNHSYSHKNLLDIETDEAEHEIAACKQYLESKGFTRASDHFVPPYCATNDDVDEIIKKYAATSRPVWSKFNYLPIYEPDQLGFMEVTNETSPQTVKEWIDTAVENGLWLVLMFHSLESPAELSTQYDAQSFSEIIAYLDEKNSQIKCVTLSDLLDTDILLEPSCSNNTESSREWQLVWEDHFNGTSLEQKTWNVISAKPFANNELQTYREENVSIADGFMQIQSNYADKTYFSGAVTTDNKKLLQYGKLEIRAKLPYGKGIFPAIWLKPSSGDVLPEIDIVEFLGHEPDSLWHVFHYEKDGQKEAYPYNYKATSFIDDFHVFSIEWSRQHIRWFVDGIETFAVDSHIPACKMYLYINTAVGGDWPGDPDRQTIFPQTFLIDYVKYFSRSENE